MLILGSALLSTTALGRDDRKGDDKEGDDKEGEGKKDERYDRLEKGEVIVVARKVKGSDTRKVRAIAIIKAKPEKVWNLVEHCANYATTMKRIKASEEVSRKGNVVRCRTTVEMPFPLASLTSTTKAVHTAVPGKKYQRKWKLEEGDYKVNEGSWTLTPYAGGEHTLVVYEVHAEPKVAIPPMIQRAAQQKTLPELFEHLRKQLE